VLRCAVGCRFLRDRHAQGARRIGASGPKEAKSSFSYLRSDDNHVKCICDVCIYIYIYIYIYICVCVCVCVKVYIGEQESISF